MNIAVVGKGQMGTLIASSALERGHLPIQGDALDPEGIPAARENLDVLMDFSHPASLDFILDTVRGTSTALVLGTTGYSEQQLARIEEEAAVRPVFFASNYSLGVAVLTELAARAATILDGWDCEIVETHHRRKVDAPSGTALSLLAAVDPEGEYEHVFGREGKPGPRGREIGIHAVRGGSVPGNHEVMFLGDQETVTLSHSAQNRQIFVNGALDAAEYIQGKPNGLYNMKDLIGERI